MKCSNCGAEFASLVNFCTACGAKLDDGENNEAVKQEQPVIEQEQVQQEQVQQEQAKQDEERPAEAKEKAEDVSCEYEEKAAFETEKPSHENRVDKKTNRGIVKKLVIAAVVVFAVLALVLLFKACDTAEVVEAQAFPTIFVDDGDIKYLRAGDKKGRELCDEDDFAGESTIRITEDGKYIFFGADPDGYEFDLCFRAVSKKDEDANVTIVKGVSQYEISPDGSKVFYVKNGDLYSCARKKNADKNALKLGKDVEIFAVSPKYDAVIYTNDDGEAYYSTGVEKIHNEIGDGDPAYDFSHDGKRAVIIEAKLDDNYNREYTISILNGMGKKDKPQKLESGISGYAIDDDLTVIYYIKKDTLYYSTGNGASAVSGIDGAVLSINAVSDGDGANHYYATVMDKEEYDLYYVNEKKAKLLIENVDYDYEIAGMLKTGSNKDGDTVYYIRADYDNFVKINIPEDENGTVKYKYTKNSFYTIEDVDEDEYTGNLVRYDITSKGINFNKGKVIAENVSDFSVEYSDFFDNETLLVKYDYDNWGIYNGKLYDISDIHSVLWIKKDGTMLMAEDYNSEDGTYTLVKFNGKQFTTVAEDVCFITVVNEKLIYCIDENEDLYVNKGKFGKDTYIDDDVDYVSNIARLAVHSEDVKEESMTVSWR